MWKRVTLFLVCSAIMATAQTPRDTAHAKAQKVPIDSVLVFLKRYCALSPSSQVSYSKSACRNYAKLAPAESALLVRPPAPPPTFSLATMTTKCDSLLAPMHTADPDTSLAVTALPDACQYQYVSPYYLSDSLTLVNGSPAAYVSPNVAWTAWIQNAKWIWKTPLVADPTKEDTTTFTRAFYASGSSLREAVVIDISADDGYRVLVNNHLIVDSLVAVNPTTFKSVAHYVVPESFINAGVNTLTILVRNAASPTATSPLQNPAGLLYSLYVNHP